MQKLAVPLPTPYIERISSGHGEGGRRDRVGAGQANGLTGTERFRKVWPAKLNFSGIHGYNCTAIIGVAINADISGLRYFDRAV